MVASAGAKGMEFPPDAILGCLLLWKGLHLQNLHLDPQPKTLQTGHIFLSRLPLLDLLEVVEGHPDEAVDDHHVSQEEEDHEEDLDVLVLVVGGWLSAIEVHGFGHHADPPFHRAQHEHGQHRVKDIAVVDPMLHPVSSPLHAIIGSLHLGDIIGIVAVVALGLVNFGEDEGEEQQEEESHHQQL